VLARLHEPRFVDLAPAEVYATLLDEGAYLCSERTMYRLLAEHAEVRERRDQLQHPTYDVHFGLADERVVARATVLATAYAVHPERFPRGLPQPPARPKAVWINPPKRPAAEETRGLAAPRGSVLDHARPGQVFSAQCSDLDRRGCVETPA
jgi:hypothetical protein